MVYLIVLAMYVITLFAGSFVCVYSGIVLWDTPIGYLSYLLFLIGIACSSLSALAAVALVRG